ncbi:LamG domain-containing protein [Hyalangium gracile]|uniref:LamG domain-containing protein n=1 Tax=Hyalangium gracile TaxID=394092 RepID=UPI001CCFF68D|nr:LamG domain-containing protein [Hyalangium gracile]
MGPGVLALLGLWGTLTVGCGGIAAEEPRPVEPVGTTQGALGLPGPVAHWAMEDASGSSMLDSSGNGATGTRYNGYGRTLQGRINSAFTFDGVDDRVEVPDRPAFHFTSAMTVSAWVKPSRITGLQSLVGKWYSPDAYILLIQDGQYRFTVQLSNGQLPSVSAPATVNQWAHVAGVFNGSSIQLYVNGVLAASAPAQGTIQDSARPLVLANHPSWNAYAGALDEVRLYNVPLTSRQVRFLAEAMKRRLAVVRYDPMTPSGRLTTVLGWPSATTRAQMLVDTLQAVTNGAVNYQIVENVVINAFPKKLDGFRYTYSTYMACRADPANCHMPDEMSYASMLAEYKTASGKDLCAQISSGAVDEVWMWGGDYFGFDEFAFKIPGDQPAYSPQPYNYWIYDGRKKDLPVCGRTYFVMGFNWDVGFDNQMHSYGHRIESALTIAPPGQGYWHRCSTQSSWTQFTCIDQDAPGGGSCGDVHYPVNGASDYDYGNTAARMSSCAQWDTYPEMNLGNRTPVDCSTWGCSQEGYLTYWLSRIPKNPGNSTTEHYNWWKYIVDYDTVYRPLP